MPRGTLPSSQNSAASEDGLMTTLVEQMHTTLEKKRKDKEVAFLQSCKAELVKCNASNVQEFGALMEELNEEHTNFVMELAVVEDNIRKTWEQVLQEQRKLVVRVLAEHKHKQVQEQDKAREKGHLDGMHITKRAIGELSRLRSTLEQRE